MMVENQRGRKKFGKKKEEEYAMGDFGLHMVDISDAVQLTI